MSVCALRSTTELTEVLEFVAFKRGFVSAHYRGERTHESALHSPDLRVHSPAEHALSLQAQEPATTGVWEPADNHGQQLVLSEDRGPPKDILWPSQDESSSFKDILGMLLHALNPSTHEAVRSLRSQTRLHDETLTQQNNRDASFSLPADNVNEVLTSGPLSTERDRPRQWPLSCGKVSASHPLS